MDISTRKPGHSLILEQESSQLKTGHFPYPCDNCKSLQLDHTHAEQEIFVLNQEMDKLKA